MFIVIPEDHVFLVSMKKHATEAEAEAAATEKAQEEQGRKFVVMEVVSRVSTDKPVKAPLPVTKVRTRA